MSKIKNKKAMLVLIAFMGLLISIIFTGNLSRSTTASAWTGGDYTVANGSESTHFRITKKVVDKLKKRFFVF